MASDAEASMGPTQPLNPILNGGCTRMLPPVLSMSFSGLDSKATALLSKTSARSRMGPACHSTIYQPSQCSTPWCFRMTGSKARCGFHWCYLSEIVELCGREQRLL